MSLPTHSCPFKSISNRHPALDHAVLPLTCWCRHQLLEVTTSSSSGILGAAIKHKLFNVLCVWQGLRNLPVLYEWHTMTTFRRLLKWTLFYSATPMLPSQSDNDSRWWGLMGGVSPQSAETVWVCAQACWSSWLGWTAVEADHQVNSRGAVIER